MHEIVIPGMQEAVPQKHVEENQRPSEVFLTTQGLARRVEFFDANEHVSQGILDHLNAKHTAYIANGEHSPIREEDVADAEERSAVLALRVEAQPEKVNDSLSSLARVGMRAFQAMVYGQRLVVSIEPGFEDVLRQSDAGAVAQYEALRVKLDSLEHETRGMVRVLYDSTEDQMLQEIDSQLRLQELPLTALHPLGEYEILSFAQERQSRLAKTHRKVTIGGSSSPFSRQVARQFNADQRSIAQVWKENSRITMLNEGYYKIMWDAAYASGIGQEERIDLMNQAFLSEQGPKDVADVLVWLIQAESVSKAALTEIGFLLMNAFKNGQQLVLLLEPFDGDAYIRHLLKKHQADLTAKFPNDPLLAELERDESAVTLAKVKASALAATAEFKDAEAAVKVRQSVEHELEDVQATVRELTGKHSVELFTLSRDVSDCIQKSRLVGSPERAEGRGEFYRNFDRFKANFRKLVKENPGARDKAVQLVEQALPKAPSGDLKKHLEEATETSSMLAPYVTGEKTGRPESPFLPKQYMELMTTVVTPLHDVLKFLGDPTVQSLPDHEVLMGYIVNEFFPQLGFTPEEVDFLTQVIGNHENIFKEKGREKYAASETIAERGMALFFLIDNLTGAIYEEDGKLALNSEVLKSRFTDLYVRHMDPVSRKLSLPRPEWGLFTVKDYIATCKTLREEYGVQFSDSFIPQIVDAALAGIKITFDLNGTRASTPGNEEPKLTDDQIMKILSVQDELKMIRASL